MAKKIYDVVPPKVANKIENTVRDLSVVKSIRKKRVAKTVKPIKKGLQTPPPQVLLPQRSFPKREVFIGLFILSLLVGVYFLGKLPKAEIEISPALETISIEDKILADKSVSEIDLAKKIIPLRLIEDTKELSQSFPATGIASNDGKATGTIKIYNKTSPASQVTLVSGTHFLSDSGKYFVTLSKITVPAMKGKAPGSVSVSVQAEQPGSDYNIKPSKFSVPKLSGTIYYYGIWGESSEEMSGGYTGKVKKVTKDDIDSAEDVLTQKLLSDVENSLKSKVSEGEVLVDGSISSKVIEAIADVKAGTVADSFNQSAKVKASAFIVNKSDLEMIAREGLMKQLGEGKVLLDSSLNLTYSSDAVDFSKGTEKINLQASAKNYYSIDSLILVDLFKRKKSTEIQDIVKLEYGEKVSVVKVKFWPFWVNSAPKNPNRIEINLKFE